MREQHNCEALPPRSAHQATICCNQPCQCVIIEETEIKVARKGRGGTWRGRGEGRGKGGSRQGRGPDGLERGYLRGEAAMDRECIQPIGQSSIKSIGLAPPLPAGLVQHTEGGLLLASIGQSYLCWAPLVLQIHASHGTTGCKEAACPEALTCSCRQVSKASWCTLSSNCFLL